MKIVNLKVSSTTTDHSNFSGEIVVSSTDRHGSKMRTCPFEVVNFLDGRGRLIIKTGDRVVIELVADDLRNTPVITLDDSRLAVFNPLDREIIRLFLSGIQQGVLHWSDHRFNDLVSTGSVRESTSSRVMSPDAIEVLDTTGFEVVQPA